MQLQYASTCLESDLVSSYPLLSNMQTARREPGQNMAALKVGGPNSTVLAPVGVYSSKRQGLARPSECARAAELLRDALPGYEGYLCMECSVNHYASGRLCKKCTNAAQPSSASLLGSLVLAVCVVVVIFLAVFASRRVS